MLKGYATDGRKSLALTVWCIWSVPASYETEIDSTRSVIARETVIVNTNLTTVSHYYPLMISKEIPASHQTYSSGRQDWRETEDITHFVGPIGEWVTLFPKLIVGEVARFPVC